MGPILSKIEPVNKFASNRNGIPVGPDETRISNEFHKNQNKTDWVRPGTPSDHGVPFCSILNSVKR